MRPSTLQPWLFWLVAALGVVAVFAFTLPVSRARVIAGGVIAMVTSSPPGGGSGLRT